MGAAESTEVGGEGVQDSGSFYGSCCEIRDRSGRSRGAVDYCSYTPRKRVLRGGDEAQCGVGMGLDSKRLANQQDARAIITCLARGGPAHKSGVVRAGDHLVAVGDLDVEGLLSEECHGDDHSERTESIAQRLALALLGPEGSTVMLQVRRTGSSEVLKCEITRARIKPYCQWVSEKEV